MAIVDLIMPKLGESITEATILKWYKKPGDTINQDETVLDIATDKVDSEVPSTAAGIITETLFNVNDVVPVGTIIARIETTAHQNGTVASSIKEETAIPLPPAIEEIPYVPQAVIVSASAAPSNTNRFYSPLVLNIAGSEGVSMSEMENIAGTGNEGRVTKKDILEYVQARKGGSIQESVSRQPAPENIQTEIVSVESVAVKGPAAAIPVAPPAASSINYGNNVEIVEMDRMRKMIAKHMVDSKQTSPHVTSFAEADVTNIVLWREKVKAGFEKQNNTKITFTPIFIDCLVRVIKRFPIVNSSVDGDKIIIKKDINIGMATALPSGNLIVPVIKNADYLNLVGLSKSVNTMADNARNNRLKPDDTSGGTFTLTNVGTFGSLMGTPIINQPQVAILAVGAIKKRPVVIETEQGDTIGIRHMMYLSLSYDHRIVDGSIGASFLTAVAKEFENWSTDKEW